MRHARYLDFADGVGYQTALLRAIVPKSNLDILSLALAHNQVGFQTDCESQGLGPTGRLDLYWYGKGGRRNVFSIKLSTLGDPQDPALPQCSIEAKAIFAAVKGFVSDLTALPGAEIVIYPPPGPTH